MQLSADFLTLHQHRNDVSQAEREIALQAREAEEEDEALGGHQVSEPPRRHLWHHQHAAHRLVMR